MVSLWTLFSVFMKIGAFTIGGGYAMIPLMQAELGKRGWIDEKELPDIIALSQSVPGILSVNVAIFAGYKIRGLKGCMVSALGTILPSFVAILLIAMIFTGFKDNPYVIRVFKGIRPVVVALIIAPTISMARKCNSSIWTWLVTIGSALLVALMDISPIYIIVVIIYVALSVSLLRRRRSE